jgi:hypothetical protein
MYEGGGNKKQKLKKALDLKIIHWPQTWTFSRTRTRNYGVCASEEKHGALLTCGTMNTEHGNLQDHTKSRSIISRLARVGLCL